jgi:signal transduction histidine kinase
MLRLAATRPERFLPGNMDLLTPNPTATELAAAFLQAAIVLGLASLCLLLYQRYRKAYLGYWALAWLVYALRLGAIISFLATAGRVWLFWHQVATGWTALALLWAALVFSRQLKWRMRYLPIALFPPVWSYVAIYELDSFMLAAAPAVAFLSTATLWTAWVFLRHYGRAKSTAALVAAVTLFFWALHHLDYPFLRAQGAWNPWGYYLDIVFVLGLGASILLLIVEDLDRGLRALSEMSRDLQRGGRERDVLGALLERALTLPAVHGSAMYARGRDGAVCLRGAGACSTWSGTEPTGEAGRTIVRVLDAGQPEVARDWPGARPPDAEAHAFAAVLPVLQGSTVAGALVLVCAARDPFAALDTSFLVALGQHVGAALANTDLTQRLEARTAELEHLATRMVEQHEEERRRLSRELHDETAQVFSAVKLQLGVAREAAPPDLAPRLARALELVDTGIRSIRAVTQSLRPSLLDDLGLLPALRALATDFANRSGVGTTLDAPVDLPSLSPEAELALFRALQEALANVGRHAKAGSVRIGLAARDGTVTLTIADDGRGLAPEIEPFANGRMGLVGMRERITGLGGTVEIGDGPSGGVRVVVSLPSHGGGGP